MKRPGYDLSWKAIRHRHIRQTKTIDNPKTPCAPLLEESSKSLLANITNMENHAYVTTNNQLLLPIMNRVKNSSSNHNTSDTFLPYDLKFYHSDLRMIMSELKYLANYIRKEEEDDSLAQDWKFSAMVIDRLCLILFSLMTPIFSYVTLFSAPNFLKFR